MSLIRQTYVDSLRYLLSRVIPALVGYASIIFFIRLIGIEEYGKFSYLNSFAIMASSLSVSWLNQSIIKYYHQDSSKAGFQSLIYIGFGISIAFQLIIIFLLIFFNIAALELRWAIILSMALSLYLFVRTQLQINFKTKEILYLEGLKNIFSISLSLLLIYFLNLLSYHVIILGNVASILLFSFISFKYIKVRKFYQKFVIKDLSKYIKFGLPIGLWLFIIQAFGYYDRYLIDRWLSPSELGVFSSISDLSGKLFSFALFPIVLAVHPIMAKNWETKKEEIKIIYKKIFYSLMAVFLLVIIISTIFKSLIFTLITGADYNGEYFLIFIIISQFFWQSVLLIQKPLELNNKSKFLVGAVIITAIVHISITQIYTPQYGLFAQSISYTISGFLYIIIVLLLNRFNPNK